MNRNRDALPSMALCVGQPERIEPNIGAGGLVVHRNGVVEQTVYSLRFEVRLKGITSWAAQHEQVVHVTFAVLGERKDPNSRILDFRGVDCRDPPARLCPSGEMFETFSEDRGLQFVQTAVQADHRMLIADGLSVVSQLAGKLREILVRGGHGSAVADATKILGRIVAPAGEGTPISD